MLTFRLTLTPTLLHSLNDYAFIQGQKHLHQNIYPLHPWTLTYKKKLILF